MATAPTFVKELQTTSGHMDEVGAHHVCPAGPWVARLGSLNSVDSKDSGHSKGRHMLRELALQSSETPRVSTQMLAHAPAAPAHVAVPALALAQVPAPQEPGSELSLRGLPAAEPHSGRKPSYNLLIVDDSALTRKVPCRTIYRMPYVDTMQCSTAVPQYAALIGSVVLTFLLYAFFFFFFLFHPSTNPTRPVIS